MKPGPNGIKKTRRIVAVCLTAAACALAAFLLTPPERDLLKRARIVEPREDYVYPHIPGRATPPLRLRGDWPYTWLAPGTLLTIHSAPNSSHELAPRLTILRSDRSIPASFLTGFAQTCSWQIEADDGKPFAIAPNLTSRASPNGEWVLATRTPQDGQLTSGECEAIRTDGGRTVSWPNQSIPDDLVWLRDNRRWVGLANSMSGLLLTLCDVEHGGTAKHLTIDSKTNSRWESGIGCNPALAGTLADGKVLAIDWLRTEDGSVVSLLLDVDVDDVPALLDRISIPGGRQSELVLPPILSPQGDRLAWFTSTTRLPPGWPETPIDCPCPRASMWGRRASNSCPI